MLCINLLFFSQLLVLETLHLVNNEKYTLSHVNILTKTDKSQGVQSSRKAETLHSVCCQSRHDFILAALFIGHRDTESFGGQHGACLKWTVGGRD